MNIDTVETTIMEKVERIDGIMRKFIELGKESGGDYEEEIDDLLEIRYRYSVCKDRVEDIKVLRE